MIKTKTTTEYYCHECDGFHKLEEFIDKGWGFCCPITNTEIKYWKNDEDNDSWIVAKLLGYEE